MKIVKNSLAFGITLLLLGVLTVVFNPANLTFFTQRIYGPPEPIGTVISLIGLSLAIAGGYRTLI
jgi:hypothetical protein